MHSIFNLMIPNMVYFNTINTKAIKINYIDFVSCFWHLFYIIIGFLASLDLKLVRVELSIVTGHYSNLLKLYETLVGL